MVLHSLSTPPSCRWDYLEVDMDVTRFHHPMGLPLMLLAPFLLFFFTVVSFSSSWLLAGFTARSSLREGRSPGGAQGRPWCFQVWDVSMEKLLLAHL